MEMYLVAAKAILTTVGPRREGTQLKQKLPLSAPYPCLDGQTYIEPIL
jgi:hypothetical protein